MKSKQVILGAALALVASGAFASSYCSSAGSSYGGYYHEECKSSVPVRPLTQTMVNISDAVVARFTSNSPAGATNLASLGKGMAAGNGGKLFVWANATGAESDFKSGNTQVGYEGLNGVVGLDYAISPSLVAGVTLAADTGDTYIGAGRGAGQRISGQGIAPYVGWMISPEWTLDASLGFGAGKQEAGSVKQESDRLSGGANLTFTRWTGNFQWMGKASYFHTQEKFDDLTTNTGTVANTGLTNRLNQVRLGGQVGIWTAGGIMPFAGLAYTNDLSRSSNGLPWDRDAFIVSAGFMATSVKEGISASLSLNQETGRSSTQNFTWGFNLNMRF